MLLACQEVLDNTENLGAAVPGYSSQISQICASFASSTKHVFYAYRIERYEDGLSRSAGCTFTRCEHISSGACS